MAAKERLQKILARAGVASRRAAEALIVEGRVRVNGKVVQELGAKADPRHDKVEVDGKRLVAEEQVYILLHKPRGVVSTMSDPEGRLTVRDLLKGTGGRVYPVGRLDYATSGVLLATNDGDFAEALMHPRRGVPKTYVVKVSGEMKEDDVERWRRGVKLEDGVTLPAKVSLLRYEGDKTWLELTIREGRNQQIRRMGEATGFSVMRLARTSFAGVTSEGVRPGGWRPLTLEELRALKQEYGVPKRMPHVLPDAPAPRRGPLRLPREAPRPNRDAKGARQESPGPRYGGGSPGRRDYGVRKDWGGGSGRGRTPSEGGDDHGHARGDSRGNMGRGGGRGDYSRTTGTGGGVRGAPDGGDDSYRISRTRRGR